MSHNIVLSESSTPLASMSVGSTPCPGQTRMRFDKSRPELTVKPEREKQLSPILILVLPGHKQIHHLTNDIHNITMFHFGSFPIPSQLTVFLRTNRLVKQSQNFLDASVSRSRFIQDFSSIHFQHQKSLVAFLR